MKFLRPNHQHQIPAANQSKSARCHAQPIVQHSVIGNRVCAQTLQRMLRRRPLIKTPATDMPHAKAANPRNNLKSRRCMIVQVITAYIPKWFRIFSNKLRCFCEAPSPRSLSNRFVACNKKLLSSCSGSCFRSEAIISNCFTATSGLISESDDKLKNSMSRTTISARLVFIFRIRLQ